MSAFLCQNCTVVEYQLNYSRRKLIFLPKRNGGIFIKFNNTENLYSYVRKHYRSINVYVMYLLRYRKFSILWGFKLMTHFIRCNHTVWNKRSHRIFLVFSSSLPVLESLDVISSLFYSDKSFIFFISYR